MSSISYGIPWNLSLNTFINANYWLSEIVRAGFVFIIGFLFIILLKYSFNDKLNDRRNILVFSSIIFITSLLFIMRGAGRIDPNSISRLGIATVYIVGLLFPILTYYLFSKYKRMIVLSIIVFFISIYGYIGNSFSLTQFIANVNSNAHLPSNFRYSKNIGIDNLGNGVFEDIQINRLLKIKSFLDSVLDENETFLNLTNRNALYFYLNKKVPIETGAFYNR